ncbi:MAG: hypothetical protein ACE363_08870 [Alphaproteobacteria bacterium]
MVKNSITKTLALAFMVSAGSMTLAACDSDGPLEEAGEDLDNAAEDISDGIEDAAN